MTTLTTPSPYLRDRLLAAVNGLRDDAETARLNLAEADQDVAAARALLAEAEAQQRRAQAEVDGITRGVAWLEREARQLTAEITAHPDARHTATGLIREEPEELPVRTRSCHCGNPDRDFCPTCDGPKCGPCGRWLYGKEPGSLTHQDGTPACSSAPVSATLYQDNGLPMVWSTACAPGGYVCAMPPADAGGIDMPDGTRICGMPVESEPCGEHGHLPAPLTAPGHIVATSGPTTTAPIDPGVTTPDAGLAHPVPNPPTPSGSSAWPEPKPAPLEPAAPTGEPRHAKAADRPGLIDRIARLTGGHRIINDEPQGDDRG